MKDCERCGAPVAQLYRAQKLANPNQCGSCQVEPVTRIYNGKDYCEPWQGELNDLWQPINSKGELVLPGERRCGNADCVRLCHVLVKPVRQRKKKTKPTEWSLEGTLRILAALSDLKGN